MGSRTSTKTILDTLGEAAVSHQIILTKCDQIGVSELTERMAAVAGGHTETAGGVSRPARDLGKSGTGIAQLRAAVARLLAPSES